MEKEKKRKEKHLNEPSRRI